MSLRISEIFLSVQGEGIWSGIPSSFIRTSGCNLRCVWCDTPYASWHPDGDVLVLGRILEHVLAHKVDHVVITGGEPMLFDPVSDLCHQLKAAGKVITIETAGTIFRDLACDLMSISPKLSNSTPPSDTAGNWSIRHEETRKNLEPLCQLIETYDCQLKFVLTDPASDIPEIENLLAKLPAMAPDRILLMPEGRDSTTLNRRMKALVQPAIERGWRICPRMQIYLFGDTRGT